MITPLFRHLHYYLSELAETSTLTASGDKSANVYQLFVLGFFLLEQVYKPRILESLEISQHHLSLKLQGIHRPFHSLAGCKNSPVDITCYFLVINVDWSEIFSVNYILVVKTKTSLIEFSIVFLSA